MKSWISWHSLCRCQKNISGGENQPRAGKYVLGGRRGTRRRGCSGGSFMSTDSFVMLEIVYIICVKLILDNEASTFQLQNRFIGFIFLQWKCFWQWQKNIDSGFFFHLGPTKPNSHDSHDFLASFFSTPFFISFRACIRGALLLGQVVSQVSVVTLKHVLFKVIVVTGGFHQWDAMAVLLNWSCTH